MESASQLGECCGKWLFGAAAGQPPAAGSKPPAKAAATVVSKKKVPTLSGGKPIAPSLLAKFKVHDPTKKPKK